ncbi:MAG: low molecular weight protein-tyrosine-phosphatase [Pseudomonadota bacterium]
MAHSILFVCLGNTCRSPMAEGILRALRPDWRIDSAGTGLRQPGSPPDPRAIAVTSGHGLDITHIRSRPVQTSDFEAFDRIIAMDLRNLSALNELAPPSAQATVSLLLPSGAEVPDPYEVGGYDSVFEMIRAACETLAHADETSR